MNLTNQELLDLQELLANFELTACSQEEVNQKNGLKKLLDLAYKTRENDLKQADKKIARLSKEFGI